MLPAPNLDDRRFQDLVDEAKRLVQQRCPTWTDHNVSDPGVTLIETFATMVDQLFYRLNRVPDRLYVKFLELIGEQLEAPAAARVDLTFWLSAPRSEDTVVPVDTVVATERHSTQEAVEFATVRDLVIPPCRVARVAVHHRGGEAELVDLTAVERDGFEVFSAVPQLGDQLLVGLDRAVPSGVVELAVRCPLEGPGPEPSHPPRDWRAWTGDPAQPWVPCEVLEDTTNALNRDGRIVLQLPDGHTATSLTTSTGAVVAGTEAGWLACVVADAPGAGGSYGTYTASPRVRQVVATTLGGTVPAVNARAVRHEVVGISDGTAGQRFALQRRPVVLPGDEPIVVRVGGDDEPGWEQVRSFGESGRDDRHVVLDLHAGELAFGPAVRLSDGTVQNFGAVPPAGALVRVDSYRYGGGVRANVAAGQVTKLHAGLPFVRSVTNRRPAEGGTDGETIEAVKLRGPVAIRTRDRAVTARDYEVLARRAAPELVRVRAIGRELQLPDDSEAGTVRVLVVPPVTLGPGGEVALDDLVPSAELVERVRAALDRQRCLGTRLVVEAPFFQGVHIEARLTAAARVLPEVVQRSAQRALYGLLCPVPDPVTGLDGWPFDQPVLEGRIHALLEHVEGCAYVDEVLVRTADAAATSRSAGVDGVGDVGDPVKRIDLDARTLVLSVSHQVKVAAPRSAR